MKRALWYRLVAAAALLTAGRHALGSVEPEPTTAALPRTLNINTQIIVNAACERAAARLRSCQLANVKAMGPEGVQTSCCQPFNDLVALNCFW